MKAFADYVQTLKDLYLDVVEHGPKKDMRALIDTALDGQAGRELRKLIPLVDLRAAGAFFTGSDKAERAAARLMPSFTSTSRIFDPACGAGDLLIACARHLPTGRGFQTTLSRWGQHLVGRDIQPEFVAAARYRLALAAYSREFWPTSKRHATDPDSFSQVVAGCGLSDSEVVGKATHIIVNPPFNLVPASDSCEWTSGNVCSAAIFLDELLQSAAIGTRVVAILPDVLRSGGRYRRWRDRVTQLARVESIDLLGQFDRWADVDVFLLHLVITRKQDARTFLWRHPTPVSSETVGDRFAVSVGPVVPFRLRNTGQWHAYVHARSVPPWGIVENVAERLRFRGTVHVPPFVVVRRTSRFGDKHRAVGTIIAGTEPVAVENHLLILEPNDARLPSCRKLLGVLKSPKTDEWLNERIRCRHLTVDAIRNLPLWKEDK